MSSAYKGNLAVGGSSLDKSKLQLQLRRPTPDSDVLASSDEDRDHVRPPVRAATGNFSGTRRMSSSWLHDIQPNRKNSLPATSLTESQPTTPGLELTQSRAGTSSFSWNTTNYSANSSVSRLREVVPSPTSAYAPGDRALPSPTAVDSDNTLSYLLSQQLPPRKSVRSQSYSVGQGDIENSPVGKFSAHLRSNLRHRPSKPSLLGESGVGLSQLREDDADELESSNGSDHGIRLPTGYWEREQKQALLKQAAVENARTRNQATSAGSQISQPRRKTTAGLRHVSYGATTTADFAIDELDDTVGNMNHPNLALMRRFSEHVSVHPRDHEVEVVDRTQKQQWATDNIPMLSADAMSRRHSFAHYGGMNSGMTLKSMGKTKEEPQAIVAPRQGSQSPEEVQQFDAAAYFAGYGPVSRAINASAISVAHPDPIVSNTSGMPTGNPYAVPPVLGRPGRRLFVVTFKCSRADIFYLYDNTGLEIRCGDLVIVEGDRGWDLGQVTHADVTMEEARKHKAAANEEHFRWLVMFSQYSMAGTTNDSGMLGSLARNNGVPNAMARPQTTGMGTALDQDAKPKLIKRLAQQHEIAKLREKEGSEAKAKRLGAQKAADHKLPMEILDAEYQADYHKLTYFYYAEAYVNFNDLVTDLFKQYKVRIWMSAVNPASVVNPAGTMQVQPPSAIGPGAILRSSAANASLAVGPGFGGNNLHHANQAYEQWARGRQQPMQSSNYDEGYNAFSYQIPNYTPQAGFNVSPWGPNQQLSQQMYNPFPMQGAGYPNATASGSPMNYGAYYPPTTYGASSAYGAAGNRGAYTSTSPHPGVQSYNSRAGASYGQSASPSNNDSSGGSRSGHTTTQATAHAPGYDPTLMAAMQNLSFGK